jgi:hypothetical protein
MPEVDSTRQGKAALIDATVPNAARVADYLNGRRNNFAADRKAAQAMLASGPGIAGIMPASRAFHQRVVHYLATQARIRQFIDVGTGLTGTGSTRQIAQAADPACRIVFVSNDPMVLSHALALERSTPEGAVGTVDADEDNPAAIVAGAALTLDFTRPIAIILPSTLTFIDSTKRAAEVVSELMAGWASGHGLGAAPVIGSGRGGARRPGAGARASPRPRRRRRGPAARRRLRGGQPDTPRGDAARSCAA